MSGLSNIIEKFLIDLINNTEDGIIEIGRNEVATRFNCAPSQINYVLSTRFTPYKGYYIESRRGGGGYIKIIKASIIEDEEFRNIILEAIGQSISKSRAFDIVNSLVANEVIDEKNAEIIKVSLSDRSLEKVHRDLRDQVRADILINLLLILSK